MMKQWWQARAPRERVILVLAALAMTAMLYFLLIWEPLQQGNSRLQADRQEAHELNAWLRGIEPELAKLRSVQGNQRQAGKGSVLAVADSRAKSGGLGSALKRMQPDGDNSVRAWLENAPFNTLLAWLHQLEKQDGIQAVDLNISRDDESGQVKARLTLSR